MGSLVFTICSRNYLAYALTLRESLLAAVPGTDFRVVLVDELDAATREALTDVSIIEAEALGIDAFFDMALRYTVVELNTAVKAAAFLHFFSTTNAASIIYFDPDIMVLRPLDHVDALLSSGKDIVVTPHICHPLEDGHFPDDQRHLQTGIYNLGFCAIRRSEQSLAFLEWWARKLKQGCHVDVSNGVFVDQKYLDLVTCFVDEVAVLRHPGYNVAYWNLPHRPARRIRGQWVIGTELIYFFHFSGIDPDRPHLLSRHQDRYRTVDDIGEAKALVQEYINALLRNKHTEFCKLDYKYGRMSDGTLITDEMRRIYVANQHHPAQSYVEAFHDSAALYTAPSKYAPRFSGIPLTSLMYEVWRSRRDLQQTFQLSARGDQLRYLKWFVETAPNEHKVDDKFIQPLREVLVAQRTLGKAPNSPNRALSLTLRTTLLWVPGLQRLYRLLPLTVRIKLNWHVFGTVTPTPRVDGRIALDDGRPNVAHVDPTNAPGATVVGFLRAESGIGEAGRRTYGALKEAGYSVSPYAMPTNDFFEEADASLAEELTPRIDGRHVILQINADNTLALPSLFHRGELAGRYRIGIWAWELSQFPAAWESAFDQIDEIWAPSSFIQHVLAQATFKPVFVMPHPVPIFPQIQAFDRRYFGLKPDAFIVLVSLDLNSFAARKNPMAAVQAVRLASKQVDGLQLVIKVHGRRAFVGDREELAAMIRDIADVVLIDRVITRQEMDALQHCCDVYASLHRSEGFGLNIAECMAKGKLVIATNYSGSRDFLDSTCGAPVGFSLRPVREGEYPYHEQQWWAEPDVRHAAELLVRAAHDSNWRLHMGQAAQERIRHDFSYESVGVRMRLRLERIDAEIDARSRALAATPAAGRTMSAPSDKAATMEPTDSPATSPSKSRTLTGYRPRGASSRSYSRLTNALTTVAAAGLAIELTFCLAFWARYVVGFFRPVLAVDMFIDVVFLRTNQTPLSYLLGWHNEHVVATTRLLSLADIVLFGLQYKVHLWASIGCLAFLAAAMAYLLLREPSDGRGGLLVFLLVCLLAPLNVAVVAMPYFFQHYCTTSLGLALSICTYYFLQETLSALRRVALATACIILAFATLCSGANGIAIVFASYVTIALLRVPVARLSKIALLFSAAVLLLIWWKWLNSNSPIAFLNIRTPGNWLAVLHYEIRVLALPAYFASLDRQLTFFFGAVVLAAGIYALASLLRRGRDPTIASFVFCSMLLGHHVSVAMIALGRSGTPWNAEDPKYFYYATIILASTAALIWRARIAGVAVLRASAMLVLALVGYLLYATGSWTLNHPRALYKKFEFAAVASALGVADPTLVSLAIFEPDQVELYDYARAAKLNVFGWPELKMLGHRLEATGIHSSCSGLAETSRRVSVRSGGAAFLLEGWAFETGSHARDVPNIVIADERNIVVGVGIATGTRADIASKLKAAGVERTILAGWQAVVRPVGDGHRYSVFAVQPSALTACRLADAELPSLDAVLIEANRRIVDDISAGASRTRWDRWNELLARIR
jgi:glycosyltransferase involved in cell wall biosynthesis